MRFDVRTAGSRRLPLALIFVAGVAGCAAPMGDRSAKDEEHAAEHEWTTTAPLTSSEDRYMYFEGSCHFLACCAKHNCGLAASAVTGACGTGCSDSTPWIARPNRDFRYACGECVRVCVRGTSNCTDASVWDNSITGSGIEGNIALFDSLGLAHTDSGSSCSGSGGAWVTVSPCTGDAPADGGSDPGSSDPGTSDTGGSDPGSDPGTSDTGSDPGTADTGPDPGTSDTGSDPGTSDTCTCDAACGYCWCDTTHEGACPDSWYGTDDGCDCGCQYTDPDCSAGGTPDIPGSGSGGDSGSDPATGGGTFAGVYCTDPGEGCGGNSPCWPYYDCPSGSACDWSEGAWGRCME